MCVCLGGRHESWSPTPTPVIWGLGAQGAFGYWRIRQRHTHAHTRAHTHAHTHTHTISHLSFFTSLSLCHTHTDTHRHTLILALLYGSLDEGLHLPGGLQEAVLDRAG